MTNILEYADEARVYKILQRLSTASFFAGPYAAFIANGSYPAPCRCQKYPYS